MIEHRLVLALGLAAALPVIVSAVRALLNAWTPVFDDSVIATRAFDVLSVHSPLVGEHSDSSLASVGPVFSLGPMPVWLLAVQVRFLGDWALPVTMALVNTASIIGTVVLARRRGGRVCMFATALAVAIMCRSLPAEALRDVRTPEAALLPFMLLLFLAWSVACGEYRLLLLTVVVASFVVQAHFSLVPASLAVIVVALAGMARTLTRRREATAVPAGDSPRRWLFAAVVAGLVCWSAPLLDQAIHRPGNLVRVVQTATTNQQTVGPSFGWHALVRTIGLPPWWLQYPTSGHVGGRFFELSGTPSATATVSCVLILGALPIMALIGLRRRRLDVSAAAVIALALSGSVVVFTAETPQRLVLSLDYGLRWASPAGMFIWLVLGWSLTMLLKPTRWQPLRRLSITALTKHPASIAFAALGLTALVGILVATTAGADLFQWTYRPVRTMTARLLTRLPHKRPVLVIAGSIPGFTVQEGLVYQLRRAGYRVFAPADLAVRLGSYYSPQPGQNEEVLFVGDSNTPPPSPSHTIVRVPVHGAPPGAFTQQGKPPPTDITASVLPTTAVPVGAACPPAARALASGPTINQLRVVPGQVSGTIDASQVVAGHALFCGWAASIQDRRPAASVLVFSGGRLVGAVKPTISRLDVARTIGAFAQNSGYSIETPLSALEHGSKRNRVQLFAVEHGLASPLAFDCRRQQDEFGC